MLQKFVSFAIIFIVSGMLAIVPAQSEGGVKPSVIAGDVVTLGDKKLGVNTKTGVVVVSLTDKTAFKRVSAESLDFKTAATGAVSDIGVGDKVTVTGILAADGKSIPARSVYFITKADMAQKNAKETEEWQKRGITGRVVSVNPQTNQITLEVRNLGAASNVTLTPKETAKFLRYAPDSIRYDEAKASSLAEIKAGDMLRSIGDRALDGTSFAAERIITGAFQTVAGTVKSVDAVKGEILIKNLKDGKDVTVVIGETSTLKRFPAEMAERLAGAQMAGAGGARPVGAGAPQVVVQTSPAGPAGQGPGAGRPGAGGQRPGGIDDMLERLPGITAADLKVGDMIAISSTKNGSIDRLKAIKLVAGVEPFLRMAQANGGRRGGGVDGSFTIPGLDGVGP